MEITMKLVKTIICSALAVLAAAGALTGCSDNKPNSSQVSYTEYVTPEDFSTTDEAKEKTTFKGTGKNSQLEVSASVYGKTYTLGKSTVEDMLGDGWQKSEDNWQKFPSDKKIPAHSVNIIAKNLYQGEGEDKRSLFIRPLRLHHRQMRAVKNRDKRQIRHLPRRSRSKSVRRKARFQKVRRFKNL